MTKQKARKALLKLFRGAFSEWSQCEEIDVKEAYRLPEKKIRIQLKEYPFQLNLFPDGKSIQIYPEKKLQDGEEPALGYILFDPESYYSEISGFFRLEEGDRITLGGKDHQQRDFLNISPDTPERKLSIRNDEGNLIFKSHVSQPKSCLSPLLKDKKIHRIADWRNGKLQRLRRIFGGSIETLKPPAALGLIREVNDILAHEAYRPPDEQGDPGGVIELPDNSRAFIIGDLHTKSDNLLTVLSNNCFLEALETNHACLIILGDAVHPEGEGPLDEMESSILIMDLIFKLKVCFPDRVFYVRGNHDSFSDEIAKGGIPQGILWHKALLETRGKSYAQEMERFYQQLPYLAYSKHFIACHAAAPTFSTTLKEMINVKHKPKLAIQLLNNRLKSPNRPSGYSKSDVKRLRKTLGVAPDTPFIVGHTPRALDETLWENVGDIPDHYVVYAADDHWVGVMTQIGEKLYPLRYQVEQVSAIIEQLPD